MRKPSYYRFIGSLYIMVIAIPVSITYSLICLIQAKYGFGFAVLLIAPVSFYLLAANCMSDALLFPENYALVKSVFQEPVSRKWGNMLTIGLYNSLILCFIQDNGTYMLWLTFPVFPLNNWFTAKKLLKRPDVQKRLRPEISIGKLFITGDLIPFIFDAINHK
jgi:hypothetical protein